LPLDNSAVPGKLAEWHTLQKNSTACMATVTADQQLHSVIGPMHKNHSMRRRFVASAAQ
jgi:hypothetical protein